MSGYIEELFLQKLNIRFFARAGLQMTLWKLELMKRYGIYGAGKTMDETFGLIETVEKAAQIYMLTAHLPKINTIRDVQMVEMAEFFGVKYRKNFLNL